MKLRVRHKVIALALGSALLPAIVLSILIVIQERQSSAKIENELYKIVGQGLDKTVGELYGLCVTANNLMQQHIDSALNVGVYLMDQEGPLTVEEEEVLWRATNQSTLGYEEIVLPKMSINGQWLGQNDKVAQATPIVDRLSGLEDVKATIFQRMNEEGDMLRIATNVILPDGTRAIGSYIPAVEPDGKQNKVVRSVLRGEIYRGRTFVVDDWYLTASRPIFAEDGRRVVGFLGVGVRQESVSSLRRALDLVKIGENGFVWIMHGKDAERAQEFIYVQEPFPKTTHSDLIQDAEGQPFFEMVREEAIQLKSGEVVRKQVKWRNPVDPSKINDTELHFTYFRDWDWVIGVTAFTEDYAEPKRVISSAFMGILLGTAWGSVFVVVVVGFLATYLGSLITRPITFLTAVARKVAQGDLSGAIAMADERDERSGIVGQSLASAKDETGELYRSIMAMVEHLKQLIGEIKCSSVELLDSAAEITTTARSQEGMVHDFGTSSSQIAAAVKEITTTAKELTATMVNVSESAQQTGTAVGQSRRHLEKMRAGAEELAEATQLISEKLSIITERALSINTIVITIAKIADQTNLLSLNAAIEAGKAGEAGLGFEVVSRAIRRLADQTAVATQDIEQTVKEVQASVDAGVMEMNKFHQAVQGSVQDIGTLSDQVEKIIEPVEILPSRFGSVTEGMEAQVTGASHISDAIAQLNKAAHQTATSLKNFKRATDKLYRAVKHVDEGISRFHIDPEGSEGAGSKDEGSQK